MRPRFHLTAMRADLSRLYLILALSLMVLLPLRAWSEHRRDDLGFKPRTPNEAADLSQTLMVSGLGAGRAFVNLVTWQAIHDAQETGEYFRLVSLYQTVLRLQPRNPQVLLFLGEQLLDTFANKAPDMNEKWGWVKRGWSYLEDAVRKNPHSWRLREALAQVYHRKGTQFPIQLMQAELERGTDSLLYQHPWERMARQVLAAREVLPPLERDRLDYAFRRIGMSIVYEQVYERFPEYTQLSLAAQAVYRDCNVMRHRMALLSYMRAFEDDSPVPPMDTAPLAVYASLRISDILALTSTLPPNELRAERDRVWRLAARLYEKLPLGAVEHFDRRAINATVEHLQQSYREYPPIPADSIRFSDGTVLSVATMPLKAREDTPSRRAPAPTPQPQTQAQ